MDRHKRYDDDYHSSRSYHSSKSSRSRDDRYRRERRSSGDRHSSNRRSSRDNHSDRRSSYHRSDSHKSRSSIDSPDHDTKHHNTESKKEEDKESSPNPPAIDTSQMLPCQPYYVEDLREKYQNETNNENQREEKPDEENSISNFFNRLADKAINAQKNLNKEEGRSRKHSNSSKEKDSSSKEKSSTSSKEKDHAKEDSSKSHPPKEESCSLDEKSASRQLTWEEMKKVKSKTARSDTHRLERGLHIDNKIRISKETSDLEVKVEQTISEMDANAQLLQLQLFQYQQSNAFLAENINTLTKLNQQQQLVSVPSLVSPSSSINKSLHNTPSPISSFKSPDVFKFAPATENSSINVQPNSSINVQLNSKETNSAVGTTSTAEIMQSKPKYQEFIKRLEKSVGKFTSEQLKMKFKKYHKKLSPDEVKRLKKLIHNAEKAEKNKGGLPKPIKPPNKQNESKPIDDLTSLPELLKEPPSLKSPPSKDVNKEPVSDPRKQKDDVPKDYMTLPVKEDSKKQTPQFIPRGITIQTFSPPNEKKQPNNNIDDIYKPSLPKSQINDTSNSNSTVSPLPPPPPPPMFLPPPPPLPSLKSSNENVEAKKLSFSDYQKKRKSQVSNEDVSMEDEYLSFLESINSEPNPSKVTGPKPTTNNLHKSDATYVIKTQHYDTNKNVSQETLSTGRLSNLDCNSVETSDTQRKHKDLSQSQVSKSLFIPRQLSSQQILNKSTRSPELQSSTLSSPKISSAPSQASAPLVKLSELSKPQPSWLLPSVASPRTQLPPSQPPLPSPKTSVVVSKSSVAAPKSSVSSLKVSDSSWPLPSVAPSRPHVSSLQNSVSVPSISSPISPPLSSSKDSSTQSSTLPSQTHSPATSVTTTSKHSMMSPKLPASPKVSKSAPLFSSFTKPTYSTPKIKKPSKTIENPRKGFLCGECGKSFPSFVDLEIHVNQKHTNIETINKIDVNPHNSIKVSKKTPNPPKKPSVVFTKIQAYANKNPDKIKVLYPKKNQDQTIDTNKAAKEQSKQQQLKKEKKNENNEPTKIKAKKLSDSEIKEQLAKIKQLREGQQKHPENKTDANTKIVSPDKKPEKSPKKIDKMELERLIELKRMKKKLRRQKERAMKEKLKKKRIQEKESKLSPVKKVVDAAEKGDEKVDNDTKDQNKENQDTTLASQDEEPVIVTGKRQSKQTLKKKAFMEALKARQSRRKKMNEFTKKDTESKVKVVKTSGMIKAKEVILKSKKMKRGLQNEIAQVTAAEETTKEEKPDVEATKVKMDTPVSPIVVSDPPKRIPLHQQIESVFKSSNNVPQNNKPVVEKASESEKKDEAKGNDEISFENTLLSEDALENIFNRVQSAKANKLASAEGSPDASKKVSTIRKPSLSDDEESPSTKIMKKKVDRAERAARILIRNQRKSEDKKSTKPSDDSQIVQVEQIEPLKVKLHFKMADFVSEATALVDPNGYNETDKQQEAEKEEVKDENAEGENDKSKKTPRNRNRRRKGGSTTRKRSSRTNNTGGNNDKVPQQQQPRRRRSKYYVYEDELYAANEKPLFNEPIHIPAISTRSVTAKGNFDNDVVLPGDVDFDMDFDYEKQKEEVYLTTDDILASLMTLSDSCVNDKAVQEMEAARDRKIMVSVRSLLDEMVDHVSYIDNSSDEMVVKNVIDKLLTDISANEITTSNSMVNSADEAINDRILEKVDIVKDEEDPALLVISKSNRSETSNSKHSFDQDETSNEVQPTSQEMPVPDTTSVPNTASDEQLENNNQESELEALMEFILLSVEESEKADSVNEVATNETNQNNIVGGEKIDDFRANNLHLDFFQTYDEVYGNQDVDTDLVDDHVNERDTNDGKRIPSEPSEELSNIPAKQAKLVDDSFESLILLHKETRSERRNRLSRQKNAFFISELSIKEEPFDDFTEVDVQVMDEDNTLSYSFKSDVQTLNTKQPESICDQTYALESTKDHEKEPLKLYSCDRNLVLSDEQSKLVNVPTLESRSGTPETFTSSETTSVNFSSPFQNFYECGVCDLFFKSEEAFRFHNIHQHQLNGEASFSCQFCQQSFASKKHLSRHLAFKHGVSYFGESNNSNKCLVCGLTFLKRFYLKSHMKKQHKNVRVHRCNHCGVSFDCQLLLYKHKAKTHLK